MARTTSLPDTWFAALLLDVPPGPIALPSDRLVVRDWRRADRGAFARLETEPDIQRWQPGPARSARGVDLAFRRALAAPLQRPRQHFDLCVARQVDDRAIGFVHLWLRRAPVPTAALGYALLPEFWGRGLITEATTTAVRAAGEWGLRRLVAGTFGSNARSRAVLDTLGFELVGVRRRAMRKGGRLEDDCRYALDLTGSGAKKRG